MSIDGQKDKEDVMYMCNGNYSAIKNEVLPFAATRMDLEGIMLG